MSVLDVVPFLFELAMWSLDPGPVGERRRPPPDGLPPEAHVLPGLPEDEQDAVLELFAYAVAWDDRVSAAEQTLLERVHAEVEAPRVAAALARARASLHGVAVAERVAVVDAVAVRLGSPASRRCAFALATHALARSGLSTDAEAEAAAVFARVLPEPDPPRRAPG